MTEEQLEQALQPMGLPAFRSRQIRGWLEKGVGSFEEMTNLPLVRPGGAEGKFLHSRRKNEKKTCICGG